MAGVVVDAAEHGHAGVVDEQRPDLLGRGADDRQLGRHLAAQRLEGAQQHRQALALDGLADEHDPQRVAGRTGARAGNAAGGQRDAVRDDLVVAAVEAPAGPGRGLGDGDPGGQMVELAARAEQRGDHMRRDRLRVAVEGADERRIRAGQRVPAHDRRDRLVQVDDVGRERGQLAAQRRDRARRAREVGDRAVERPADRAAERHEPLGHRARLRARAAVQHGGPADVAVEGREDADLVPRGGQLGGERLDMAGDPAGVRPRVRGYKCGPHKAQILKIGQAALVRVAPVRPCGPSYP